jgi:hypothetical protein
LVQKVDVNRYRATLIAIAEAANSKHLEFDFINGRSNTSGFKYTIWKKIAF